jgi:hypothetical protein
MKNNIFVSFMQGGKIRGGFRSSLFYVWTMFTCLSELLVAGKVGRERGRRETL